MAKSDLAARLAAAAKKETKKAKKVQTETTAAVQENFEISEADIQANPVYEIITDPKLTDQKKLEALHDLKRYNEELTAEENEVNREASNQFLLYVENQLMASSQKGIEFTNDNAFALYDATVQELFGNIKTFKGYIEPFVQALEVLQKARDANIPANELIDSVQEMQDEIDQMTSSKSEKEEELAQLRAEQSQFNTEASQLTDQLSSATQKLEQAKDEKKSAEGSWNLIKRGGLIEDAQRDIQDAQRQIDTLTNNAKVNAENLERHNGKISTLETEIAELDADIAKSTDEFNSNEDFAAIATLIEITGEDFKGKREEVVTAAQTITEKAIEGIERSISRFDSGKEETGAQLNTVTNLNGMVSLISTADSKVRTTDAQFISAQKEIVDRIEAEKGEDAIYDPDYETAKAHLDSANEHVADVIASSQRASDLGGKLVRQTGTFKGLRDAYSQKEQDATKLRTSAAVEIPAQLAVTVKSVEMATATESNNMVNDAFADLSATTQKSVASVFETVSAGAGHNNEQLRQTLQSTMDTIEMMNSVEADLKQKAREGYESRQALDEAQKALKGVTESVASAVVDADHAEMEAASEQDNEALNPEKPATRDLS